MNESIAWGNFRANFFERMRGARKAILSFIFAPANGKMSTVRGNSFIDRGKAARRDGFVQLWQTRTPGGLLKEQLDLMISDARSLSG